MSFNPKELLQVVDPQNNEQGVASSRIVHKFNLPHRAAAVVLRPPMRRDQLVLRPTQDGMFTLPAIDDVQLGESPRQTATRLLQTELGLVLTTIHLRGFKSPYLIDDPEHSTMMNFFLADHTYPFSVNGQDLEAVEKDIGWVRSHSHLVTPEINYLIRQNLLKGK